MSCTNPRGHRWVDRIEGTDLHRPIWRGQPGLVSRINRLLHADPTRRICVQCSSRGRVDGQGKVQVVIAADGAPARESNTKVAVVPLAQRARWAQKRTGYDT